VLSFRLQDYPAELPLKKSGKKSFKFETIQNAQENPPLIDFLSFEAVPLIEVQLYLIRIRMRKMCVL
jgi:hypothetical protein